MSKLIIPIEPVSPWKLLKFLLQPVLVGACVTMIWYIVRITVTMDPNGRHDVEMMASGTIPGQWILYGLIATAAFNRVLSEFDSAVRAWLANDKAAFIASKGSRIHPAMYLVMNVFAVIITASYFLHAYASPINGIFTIFSAAFGFTFLHHLIVDLDDPVLGIFNVLVSKDWRDAYLAA